MPSLTCVYIYTHVFFKNSNKNILSSRLTKNMKFVHKVVRQEAEGLLKCESTGQPELLPIQALPTVSPDPCQRCHITCTVMF